MFVSHVSLEEVFVTELFIAQFAVRLNVEYLGLASTARGRSEPGLQLVPGHGDRGGGGDGTQPDPGEREHEVWHSEPAAREQRSVLCRSGPETLFLWTLEEFSAQHSQT